MGKTAPPAPGPRPAGETKREALLRDFGKTPGQALLDRILDQQNPAAAVVEMASGDFFWLVKKIGDDDSLPLLKLASADQWQHLLDMEIWRKDQLDAGEAMVWLRRLYEADRARTVRWLLSDGSELASFCLKHYVDVAVKSGDDDEFEIPGGYFTHDGVFYLGVEHDGFRPFLQELTNRMAAEHPVRYATILQGLPTVIPAEAEEDLYRQRSLRLSEYGFLPFDEALEVYAPLEPEALARESSAAPLPFDLQPDETRNLLPVLPLRQAGEHSILQKTIDSITDPALSDRVRLEFAGLCNEMISARGLAISDAEDLARPCRDTAGYLNLAVEKLCGEDVPAAGRLIAGNALLAILRVGFGYTLKLRWRAERWVQTSWFHRSGLKPPFWGERDGSMLEACLLKVPRFHAGPAEPAKAFEHAPELDEAHRSIDRMEALDRLMGILAEGRPPEGAPLPREQWTCRSLLLTFWARRLLGLRAGFDGLSPGEAASFFGKLGAGGGRREYDPVFLEDMMSFAGDLPAEETGPLREALGVLLAEFRRELESLPADGPEGRLAPSILISPPAA